jgi:hypothetical protein
MTLHFVLRVPLMSRANGRSFNTIEAHSQVIEQTGRVALAKFGNPGPAARYKPLKTQIAEDVETLLILVVKRDDRFLGYQSTLGGVHHGSPGEMVKWAPPYYAMLGESPRLWFLINAPFQRSQLADFRLASNQRPIVDVMRECRTAAMMVERSNE